MIIKASNFTLPILQFYGDKNNKCYEILGKWTIFILNKYNSLYCLNLYCLKKESNCYFYVLYSEDGNTSFITFNSIKQVIDFAKTRENCPMLNFDDN